MLEKSKLNSSITEIEKIIEMKCVDPAGIKEPIGDGIINVDLYLGAQTKILWILKEPYDEDGGGWGFDELFMDDEKLLACINSPSKATWHPIIYVSYAILNNLSAWKDMDYIRDDPEMAKVLRRIAFINVNKLPGNTSSNNAEILNFYLTNKSIILKQIEVFEPDIIIGYFEIMRQIYGDLSVPVSDEKRKSSCEYIGTSTRLYISVYHPAQTTIPREIYVNEIVESVKEWKSPISNITSSNLDCISGDSHEDIQEILNTTNNPTIAQPVIAEPMTLNHVNITDESTINTCKELLNAWSIGIPFSPTKTLGNDSEFVSATLFHLYKFKMITDIACRNFVLEWDLCRNNAASSPRNIKSYDIWNIMKDDLENNIKVDLSDTCYEANCDECKGRTQVICPNCNGKKRLDCSDCNGRGYNEIEVTRTCPTCNGKGLIDYNRRACPTCTGVFTKLLNIDKNNSLRHGSGKINATEREECPHCNKGKIDCDTCYGDGRVACPKCDATGRLEYTYSMIQKQDLLIGESEWLDLETPIFKEDLWALEQLNEEILFDNAINKQQLDISAFPEYQCHFYDDLKNTWLQFQHNIKNRMNIYIHRQRIQLIRYAAVIRYEYIYRGGTYIAWINPVCRKIAELENGFSQAQVKLFTDLAARARKRDNFQLAFYNYAKVCAIDQNNANALQQTEELRDYVALAFLVPMWLVYVIMYAIVMFAGKEFDWAYFIISFTAMLLAKPSLGSGIIIKTVGRGWILLLTGGLLGYALGPKSYHDAIAANQRNLWIVLILTILLSLTKRFRTKIKDWRGVVAKTKNTNQLIEITDTLCPSSVMTIVLIILTGGFAYLSYCNSGGRETAKTIFEWCGTKVTNISNKGTESAIKEKKLREDLAKLAQLEQCKIDAEKGDRIAQYQLGLRYSDGNGVEKVMAQ